MLKGIMERKRRVVMKKMKKNDVVIREWSWGGLSTDDYHFIYIARVYNKRSKDYWWYWTRYTCCTKTKMAYREYRREKFLPEDLREELRRRFGEKL